MPNSKAYEFKLFEVTFALQNTLVQIYIDIIDLRSKILIGLKKTPMLVKNLSQRHMLILLRDGIESK